MAVRLSEAGDDLAAHSEINITPFIDVILVLLIIFMVAAPLSTVDVPVELPVATAAPAPRPTEPVIVTVTEELAVVVGDREVTLAELPMELDILTTLNRDTRIYISADRAVPYGEMMAAIAAHAVNTGPALVSLLWLAANRDRLRAEWGG